jgi:parallel beta-helix repeat protein
MQGTSSIVEDNVISTKKTPSVPMTVGITSKFSDTTNVITGNKVIDHLVGIHCYGSSNHIIYGNNITNNYIGIAISNSTKFEINENRITNSYWYGFDITASSKNNIVRNTIANSGIYGVFLQRLPYRYYSMFNRFKRNNFIENNCSAFFKDSFFNRWIGNYWEISQLRPYPIFGKIVFGKISVHWFNIDWLPAKEPYDI